MNTSLKRNFLTFISIKLSRKGRSITKRLFKLQISEDSAVITPLAPHTPLYEAFCKRTHRKRTCVSKFKGKLISLRRRLRKNETPFRVLKPGDLNRLFAESETTPKVKPRKLFSKTPKIKSLLLKLKSRKSGTNNNLKEIVPYNSDVEEPLSVVASCFPASVLFRRKTLGFKGRISKLKRKLISLKRRSKKKKTPFRVLKPGDLNRLFAESETTPKVKPRKLFSKTPKIKSLFLKLKSRKSGTKNKSNEIVPYDSNIEKTSKRKYNKLRKYFSRMKSKWSLKVQKLRSPIVTFDESLYNEYKDVIKLLELFQGHMLPKMYIPYTYTEPWIGYSVEEYQDQVHKLPEDCEGDDSTVDHLEIVEIEDSPFEAINSETEELVSESIDDSETDETPSEAVEEGACLDVPLEGNMDLTLQLVHKDQLTERFRNDPNQKNFVTARFGLPELDSFREQEKPLWEEQPKQEPIYHPEYLQEQPLEQPQYLDELFECQPIEDHPQEERLEQQEPSAEQLSEEHKEESAKQEIRLEDLKIKGRLITKEMVDSSMDYINLPDGKPSNLSDLADLVSTDESSGSLHTFGKDDWSWYYERQGSDDKSQVLQDQPLDETVDEPQYLQDQPLDENVDESHLQEEPKEPETLEKIIDGDYYGPKFGLNLEKVHETMGLLDRYELRRDHAQTTRAHIDIMNNREGSCVWYFITTNYEQRYNTTHLNRIGRLGVLPAVKTILENDYVDDLLEDIMFRTFIIRTMLINTRKDLANLAQASFVTSSPALKCRPSTTGLEELIYKIGYDWDVIKLRFHQFLNLVADANHLARSIEDIPDDIYDSITRINHFVVKMKNEYESVLETMRVTKACVIFDLNNEFRALRGETGEQERAVAQGWNNHGPLGFNSYDRKAYGSMHEHFYLVNTMLTALQRAASLRKRSRTQVKKQLQTKQ